MSTNNLCGVHVCTTWGLSQLLEIYNQNRTGHTSKITYRRNPGFTSQNKSSWYPRSEKCTDWSLYRRCSRSTHSGSHSSSCRCCVVNISVLPSCSKRKVWNARIRVVVALLASGVVAAGAVVITLPKHEHDDKVNEKESDLRVGATTGVGVTSLRALCHCARWVYGENNEGRGNKFDLVK